MREHDTVPYSLERLPDGESIQRAKAMRDRLKERRTCRYFSDEPVPREVLEAAIEAALSDRDWQVRQAAEDLRRVQRS